MAHVFFPYSHADEALRNELEKHLTGLRRDGVITIRHDRRIGPGEDLHGQIDDQLDRADIVLLLVSADFEKENLRPGRSGHRTELMHPDVAARESDAIAFHEGTIRWGHRGVCVRGASETQPVPGEA